CHSTAFFHSLSRRPPPSTLSLHDALPIFHPYPRRLVQHKRFDDGRAWTMRPIRPEDAEPLQAFIRGLSTEARYMRFVSMLRASRSEEHTSELQSRENLVCRLLLEKKKKKT